MLAAMKRSVHSSNPAASPAAAASDAAPPGPGAAPAGGAVRKLKLKRTDVIDALDGSTASAPLHHDSPYDALTPRRNRSNAPAPPVRAFSGVGGAAGDSVHTLGSSSGIPTPAGESPAAPTMGVGVPGGMSHVPGSTAFARASAPQRQKARKPTNDLWGVNPEPWQDFATPEGDQYAAPRSTHPVYGPTVEGAAASAASSEWDMEAILRGGQRASPTPAADTDDEYARNASASPLPERDWSRVGTSGKHHASAAGTTDDRHKTRRFTFHAGKKGVRSVSPRDERAAGAATAAGAAATSALGEGDDKMTPLVQTKSVPLVSQQNGPAPPILRVQGRSQSVSVGPSSTAAGSSTAHPSTSPAHSGVMRRGSIWSKLASKFGK